MKRGRTLSGLAGLLVLSAAAVAAIIGIIAFLKSDDSVDPYPRLNPDDKTPLVVVEDKVITKFHLDLAREYNDMRYAKSDYNPPNHSILREAITLAAEEAILQKYGQGITPEEMSEERARQLRDTMDRETLNKIIRKLDPYPGMYEWIMVRPSLANNRIRQLHQSRKVQPEAYAKAEEGLKEALSNPDFFRLMKETDPAVYRRSDSRNPTIVHDPNVPQPKLPPGATDPVSKQMINFAKEKLSKLNPGEVCPEVIDEGGQFTIARLIDRGPDFVDYETVAYRKTMYDVWFEGELRKLKGEVVDPKARAMLQEGLPDGPLRRWLFPH